MRQDEGRWAGGDKQPEKMMRVVSDLLNQDLHVSFVAEAEIWTLPASKMTGTKAQVFVPYPHVRARDVCNSALLSGRKTLFITCPQTLQQKGLITTNFLWGRGRGETPWPRQVGEE